MNSANALNGGCEDDTVKIVDVIAVPVRTGFYRDDQAAIRAAGFSIESIERYREGFLPHIWGIATVLAAADAITRPGRA